MRILGLTLLALLLAAPPTAVAADETDAERTSEDTPEGEDPNSEDPDDTDPASPDDESEEGAAAEDSGPVLDRDGDPLDEDDLIEVSGLVFDYFVEDDSKKKQLGIEAPGRDYLISPGGAAGELAEQLGKTVTVKGWAVPDDAGDLWLSVEEFEIDDEDE